MVQCMYVCSPRRGKFKGTTTAAIFTRAAACILVYTRTVVSNKVVNSSFLCDVLYTVDREIFATFLAIQSQNHATKELSRGRCVTSQKQQASPEMLIYMFF